MNRKSIAAILLFFTLVSCKEMQHETARWPFGVKYEVFVRAFADGNGDGIGDLKGLAARLDYLKNLGVNGLWLMPIMKSPSYHKYDVVDYKSIDPEYGTVQDFKKLVDQAHQQHIKIIVDLVLNHTSSDHPWFQSAIKDVNSPYRNYYVWAKKDSIRKQISKKTITLDSDNITQWHAVQGDTLAEHYYGFFSSRMPDLNFDNPKVKDEIVDIGKFWLSDMGVDGFRLDAARHIFPSDRATDNHAFWIWFRTEMEKINPHVYLVGEVWAKAEDMAPYLKGLPALFNFDLGNAITSVVNAGQDTIGLMSGYKKINDAYLHSTDQYLDAPLLKNHDQGRILSLLDNRLDRARVAAGILLTLPGTPYIYYGEEIGMKGLKPDERIREPFIWDFGKSDPLQTTWEKPWFSTDRTVTPLSKQKKDHHSLFNFYKDLIHYRNSSRVLSEGVLETVPFKVNEVVSFIRTLGEERVLVLHNISDVAVTLRMDGVLALFTTIDFDFKGGAKRIGDELVLPAYCSVTMK